MTSPTPTAPGEGRTTNNTRFPNPDLTLLTRRPTSKDSHGVERVAGPHLVGWTPARLEASEEEKASHEEFLGTLEASEEIRQHLNAPVEPGTPEASSSVGTDPAGDKPTVQASAGANSTGIETESEKV